MRAPGTSTENKQEKTECPETPGLEAWPISQLPYHLPRGRVERRAQGGRAPSLTGHPQPAGGTALPWPWEVVLLNEGVCILKLGRLKMILQERGHHI